MRLKSGVSWLAAGVLLACAVSAYARIPIRQTSDNGAGNDAVHWRLMERTIPAKLTANGKSVTVTREVVCPIDGDLDAGACDSGTYIFIYQLQSTSTNVKVNIGKLPSFTKVDGDHVATYGVVICDDDLNNQELCTTDPNDPNFDLISGITFTAKKKAVTFLVPSFSNFPAGSDPEEGQGLTLYIKVTVNPNVPIPFPSLGIN